MLQQREAAKLRWQRPWHKGRGQSSKKNSEKDTAAVVSGWECVGSIHHPERIPNAPVHLFSLISITCKRLPSCVGSGPVAIGQQLVRVGGRLDSENERHDGSCLARNVRGMFTLQKDSKRTCALVASDREQLQL